MLRVRLLEEMGAEPQIPDTSLQWEIVVAIVRLTRIFQRLLCKIRCCFF